MIFAGTGGGLFCSKDKGNNWTQNDNGLPQDHVLSICINSNDHIFAGTAYTGIYRSIDNGESWQQINTGLNSNFIKTIAVNSSNNDLFVGTPTGIFYSTNNGDSWTSVNNGLTEKNVLSLIINTNGNLFTILDNDSIFESGILSPKALFKSSTTFFAVIEALISKG